MPVCNKCRGTRRTVKANGQRERQTHRDRQRETDRDRQTETDRETNTDRLIETDRERQTERECSLKCRPVCNKCRGPRRTVEANGHKQLEPAPGLWGRLHLH